MTIPTMRCGRFADQLPDFLEYDADETTRARMEAHALACAGCGALLADLRTLRIDAANLPELTPSRDLWAGIAARIDAPVVALKHAGTADRARGATKRYLRLWTGLAAAGLVAITATVTRELTWRAPLIAAPAAAAPKPTVPTGRPVSMTSSASAPEPVGQVAATTEAARLVRRSAPPILARLVSTRPSAQQTYETEIADLRTVLHRRRPQLDPATVGVIERNLEVIDSAIAQCKQALRKDPANRFLMESLNDAMDNKVQLLRTVAALPSRM